MRNSCNKILYESHSHGEIDLWRHLNDARATIPAPGNSLFVHPAANHPVVKKEEVIIAERSRLDYKY